MPWYAKALAACVMVYAMSPIDLIPDFIPAVGHLDDLVLIPAGLYLVFRLVPKQVLEECRQSCPSGLPCCSCSAGSSFGRSGIEAATVHDPASCEPLYRMN